jgi:hypothetical protein
MSLATALAILWCLALIANDRRETARRRAKTHQMSEQWLAGLYLKAAMGQGKRQRQLRGRA